jgi:hypothetical protein
MFVHFKVEVETVRVFLAGDSGSYGRREKIDTVALIKYSDDEAHVSLGHGKYTRSVLRQIESHCKAAGATSIRWEHNGKKQSKCIDDD